MHKKAAVAAILAMVLTIGGCATIQELVKQPEISFDSLAAQEMSLVQGTFLFRFNVANPNPVGLHLDDILYDLDINGQRFVSSRLDQGLDLVASGSSPLEIPVTINYLDFFDSLAKLVGSDTVDYALSGSAAVGLLRIPYRSSGKLDVPKLPDISVDSIKIDSLSFNGAALKMTLGLKNPNAFGLKMDGLEYAARIGDLELAKGTARNITPLAAKGRSLMDVAVDLDFLEMGRGAMTLFSGSSATCNFTGNMLMDTPAGTHTIPFRFDGQVPFIK